MDEFAIIQNYFANVPQGSDVLTGIGDDCAIVQPPEGYQLVMSIDTMLEGVHFPDGTAPEHVGARAFSGALSDLAAMGARPLWFTMALTIPQADKNWLKGFSEGLMAVANKYECRLVGGDTTRGPLSITIQVHGAVKPGMALKRSGAAPGDMVYVTGNMGDGAAALAVLKKEITISPEGYNYVLDRFYSPAPRIADGRLLRGIASSAIDVSDGLYADLGKICDASGVGAIIDVARIPTSDYWNKSIDEGKRFQWVLSGGDDYQLCFTVPKNLLATVDQWIEEGQLDATVVGKITSKTNIILVNDGNPYVSKQKGYDHFGGECCE